MSHFACTGDTGRSVRANFKICSVLAVPPQKHITWYTFLEKMQYDNKRRAKKGQCAKSESVRRRFGPAIRSLKLLFHSVPIFGHAIYAFATCSIITILCLCNIRALSQIPAPGADSAQDPMESEWLLVFCRGPTSKLFEKQTLFDIRER